MHPALTLGAALLAAVASARPDSQFSNTGNHCTDVVPEFGGWTGKTTSAVKFSNFPGSYDFTTQGYDASGACTSKGASAAGPIAPLSDEMTYVFRGPLTLSNFAVYQPSGGATKRSTHDRRHAHNHQRFHEKREAEPNLGDKITAVIDGKTVEMTDTWSKPDGGSGGSGGSGGGAAAPATNQKAAAPVKVASGQWGRTAHYASKGASGPESDGLTFLMAQKFTDSVSFFKATDGGLVYSPTHENLASGALVPDNTEFYIASNEACSDSNPCDMKGPNVTAYHGFKGDRMAVFEFTMPLSGDKKCDAYTVPNPDMPCIWALATHVVNNLQYGDCNGWTAGAGEHDIVEVLSIGSKNMFASMHMGKHYAGTATDSFARPVGNTMKLAVIYSGNTVQQHVLKDFDFGPTVDGSDVQGLTSAGGAGSTKMATGDSVTDMVLNQHP